MLTTHTLGVAALGNGQLEYMMLRHLNTSDDQGPWPLNDDGPMQVIRDRNDLLLSMFNSKFARYYLSMITASYSTIAG